MPHELPINLTELEDVTKTYGTPLQLYDEQLIRQNARELLNAFRAYFPGRYGYFDRMNDSSCMHADFTQYFAVKALPNPAICKVRKKFNVREL